MEASNLGNTEGAYVTLLPNGSSLSQQADAPRTCPLTVCISLQNTSNFTQYFRYRFISIFVNKTVSQILHIYVEITTLPCIFDAFDHYYTPACYLTQMPHHKNIKFTENKCIFLRVKHHLQICNLCICGAFRGQC